MAPQLNPKRPAERNLPVRPPFGDPLRGNPVFSALDAEARRRLSAQGKVRLYASGERILQEGDAADWFYVLLAGSVRVYHLDDDGLEVLAKLFGPPAVFGEMELLAGLRHLEHVSALEPATLLLLPRAAFLEALESCHGFALALLRDVCHRFCISGANEKALAFYDVPKRLATFLVSYAHFYGLAREGDAARLPVTQDEMAGALGVTRRAVAKTMRLWRAQGLVAREGDLYVVSDLGRLEREASSELSLTYRSDMAFTE
ncbi:MAG: Crp/Fnr family transcriptional regulator [Deltaproteobacteria bacterium]|nr:Crp/Fnr family transcriptional regulator [Deltaproteobacteria bacterium]